MRGAWPMTVCVSLIEPDVQISASGSRSCSPGCRELPAFRLALGLPVERSLRFSEPMPVSGHVALLSLAAITSTLSAWNTSAQLPRLRSTPISGFPLLLRGLRLLPAPFRPPPFLGLRRTLRLSPHPSRSPVIPVTLPDMPSPPRHRQSDRQTPTVVRSSLTEFSRNSSGSSLWL